MRGDFEYYKIYKPRNNKSWVKNVYKEQKITPSSLEWLELNLNIISDISNFLELNRLRKAIIRQKMKNDKMTLFYEIGLEPEIATMYQLRFL